MVHFTVAVLVGLVGTATAASDAKKLNILVLYADDWRHDTLGVAGNPVVKTPNLDQLAAQGIRFTHNYVTTSICGVSRATLLTGQWMSRHRCKSFTSFETPWSETCPGLLRANGYHVGHIGKWHNGPFPAKEYDFARSYMGKHWYEIDGETIHVTKRNEADAIEFLRKRPTEKPFCLSVAFFATHAVDGDPQQYLPQPESMRLYADVKIPVPVNATEASWKRLPPFFDENNEGRRRWRWRFDTEEKYQKYMKNYFRLATEVDATCGAILRELREQGLEESTFVLFTTDNGYFHGEHGLADKWYPFEESIRVPLVIRDPRMAKPKRGATNDNITLNVDLAPTILAAADILPPKTMQGRNIDPLYLAEKPPAWRAEFFYEHATIGNSGQIPPSEALVRRDWKYLFWPDARYEQLFDLKTDPQEENTLAQDPKYAGRLDEMRKRFAEWKAAVR